MPFAPMAPDELSIQRERMAWAFLRRYAPPGIAMPAVVAILLASQRASFTALRKWFRENWSALAHNRATTRAPSLPTPATFEVLNFIVYVIAFLGLWYYLRFSAASIRVAVEARYPQRHHAVVAGLALLVPVLGPLVAWSATSASLPSGHEARGVLRLGWGLVVLGEIAFFAVNLALLSTSSLFVIWGIVAVCGLAWLAAAYELPRGLGAIADDHDSLSVRGQLRPS
jgi:hypothetical protein